MSVEEARNIVLELAKPPVEFFDKQENSRREISRVDIHTTRITVIGNNNKRYSIPLKDLEPLSFH